MSRALLTLLAAALIGASVFFGAYNVSHRICTASAWSGDDLAWLRDEFHLSPGDLARIRALHEGYLPKCAEMCKQIAAKKREVEVAFASEPSERRETLGKKLAELASLRAQCQLQMLEHFIEVSQAMPPEQGKRYLAEMQRLTLGFHEQIEQSMSDHGDHAHGHE